LFLNAANPDQAGTQGTSIGEALRLILSAKSEDTDTRGAIIVLTDGEDHDGDAPEAIEDAAEAGWVTYIIGVGTEAGATIPITNEGQKYLKLDDQAQPVRTALNKPLMMDLAQKGKGKYFDAAGGDRVVEELGKELASLERSKMEKRSFTEHRSYFQWFLLPALVLIGFMVVANFKSDVI
jgi:Ca-activated chloride channel family protein